jgi:hypothetical protein
MRLNAILFVVFIFFNSISLFSQETVIFHNDFKNNDKGWLEDETSISKLKVNTNRRMYVLEYKYKNTKDAFTSWKEIEIDESRDYSISALLYKEKGVKDYGYGIIWEQKKKIFILF